MQTDTTKTGNILQMLGGIAVFAFLLCLFGGAWNGYFSMPHGMFPEATPSGRIARYEAFIDAMRSHRAPFVMVTVKPSLRDIFKLLFANNFIRRQVIVVINDGHDFGVVVVETARRFRMEQKIVG